ncbi:MAG: hypothetical protein JXA54_09865 [Candidatus Heimdallarchaeota archaeon]|nr:hypothetical protein [Candidatus Heimdallarchaeota archaeon]
MKQKERQKRFKIGIDYLQQSGLNLFIQSSFGKLVFTPGSFIENKEKEFLTKPYSIIGPSGVIYKLSEELSRRYQLFTEVDLQRLVRICAILITDFNGPENEDTPEILFKRLRKYMREKSNRTGWEIGIALRTLDDILGYRKERTHTEYYHLSWILNIHYNLWKEREPFEQFTVDDIPSSLK